MTYGTTFKNKNILRESTFKQQLYENNLSGHVCFGLVTCHLSPVTSVPSGICHMDQRHLPDRQRLTHLETRSDTAGAGPEQSLSLVSKDIQILAVSQHNTFSL